MTKIETAEVKGRFKWKLTAKTENGSDFIWRAVRRAGSADGTYSSKCVISFTSDCGLAAKDVEAISAALDKIRGEIWIAERDARIAAGTPRV